MWFKMTAEDGERGQQWCAMEDCSTDKWLQQEMLCRLQWPDEYVKRPDTLMRQNVVVIWLECLLVDEVCHIGTLAPDHVIFVSENSNIIIDLLRGLQPVKSAEKWADVVKPRWREYQPSSCIHYRLKSLQKVHRNACQGRGTDTVHLLVT